jgi:antitoxin (DNA-binding transcriptional repressor) of toxin-antitoxin stability system
MPADIGAYEAKTHLPALLERVARGEQITITKHGRPIARLEIANVLALSERRGRITPANSSEFIALLETLDVVIDEETPSRALGRVLDLARAGRLTAYDAAYLELAMRLGIPLAYKDVDLCDAAERLGVNVLRAA